MGKRIDETIGWIGISLILIAYGLNIFQVMNPSGIYYLSMNILGSAGVLYNSFKKKDYQPGVLNTIWALIAIIAIIRIII